MDTSAEKYFSRMIEILGKKKLLLMDMLTLTEAQTTAIQAELLDELQKLIEEKQQRIEAIDKLDEEFGIYFERLKTTAKVKKLEELEVSAYPIAKQLKEGTLEIIVLVGKIQELEKVNSTKSKKLLEQIGLNINKINQGKKINNAYNPSPGDTSSYFVDKKK